TTTAPIELHFTLQLPSGSDNRTFGTIVILHGLLCAGLPIKCLRFRHHPVRGSSRNWGTHSRTFVSSLNRPVYALDLRNHGASAHSRPMTYSAMATDVVHFSRKHSLSDVALIGHSMGGKVAMSVALDPALSTSTLSKLVVVDIAPTRGKLSEEFERYVEAMDIIERAKLSTRAEALEILQQYEQVTSYCRNSRVCAFLLTNLIQKADASQFRIPVGLIGDSIAELGSLPYAPHEAQWDGEAMFIKGARSKFLNRHNGDTAQKFFPKMKMETLDTNH
ncbi:alpha/beta-hydrolase, partial [Mycena belliarum]